MPSSNVGQRRNIDAKFYPSDGTYADLLYWHLRIWGTRSDGRRKVWEPEKFREAIFAGRDNTDRARHYNYWVGGGKRPGRANAEAISRLLFSDNPDLKDFETDLWAAWDRSKGNGKNVRTVTFEQTGKVVGLISEIDDGDLKPPPFYNLPNLPLRYIPRDLKLQTLWEALSAPTDAASGPLVLGVTGMAGLGKSVLAAAIARDPRSAARFPNGIAWLEMGERASALQKASEFASARAMARTSFADVSEARGQLGLGTYGQSCLVVLDDVWTAEAIEPWRALGSGCVVLITTQDWRVLEGATEQVFPLDILGAPESAAMLAAAAHPVDASGADAEETCERCGGLPLALNAAGALVRHGNYSWADVVAALREKALAELDTPWLRGAGRASVGHVLALSVDALAEAARQCFEDCAAFYKNAPISEAALMKLWAARLPKERDRKRLAQELVDRSLMSRGEGRTYRVHDLYLDLLQGRGAAGESQSRLLAAYTPQGGWAQLVDDGYIHNHLVRHLLDLGRLDEALGLFSNDEWMRRRVQTAQGDYAGYAADIDAVIARLAPRLSGSRSAPI